MEKIDQEFYVVIGVFIVVQEYVDGQFYYGGNGKGFQCVDYGDGEVQQQWFFGQFFEYGYECGFWRGQQDGFDLVGVYYQVLDYEQCDGVDDGQQVVQGWGFVWCFGCWCSCGCWGGGFGCYGYGRSDGFVYDGFSFCRLGC